MSFSTRKSNKCRTLASISLVSLAPGEGGTLYRFTERHLEPGPARDSSPGVSPRFPGKSNLVALVLWKDASAPAFWAQQMRSRVGSQNSKCHFVAPTPGRLLRWKLANLEWLAAFPEASPSAHSPPGPEPLTALGPPWSTALAPSSLGGRQRPAMHLEKGSSGHLPSMETADTSRNSWAEGREFSRARSCPNSF